MIYCDLVVNEELCSGLVIQYSNTIPVTKFTINKRENGSFFGNRLFKHYTCDSLVLGDPGVCGFDCTDGGVIGPGNRSPSVFRVDGDPMLDCWLMNVSIVSIPIGDGGLSSSVVERRRDGKQTLSST